MATPMIKEFYDYEEWARAVKKLLIEKYDITEEDAAGYDLRDYYDDDYEPDEAIQEVLSDW